MRHRNKIGIWEAGKKRERRKKRKKELCLWWDFEYKNVQQINVVQGFKDSEVVVARIKFSGYADEAIFKAEEIIRTFKAGNKPIPKSPIEIQL